ncbi:NADH dehydrogenase ubiquinone 1 alpha subcomplex subunit 12 [Tieghemostelium lacteum]|uniref:NADH dehydrogenase [ubiquinone] 1 alpha subcomplex subunit 12 n=1 Tax=Tieghemostelium lacteum TaxID=361077 RepID=A0A152A930_TIELA|nr:NADH dehydrogenase ubiquinone 1 alpha subcomplex subunit 12 [Tieghemostelium lacteum]|eukprot:KYR02729.1 NADH dehydrogenase ubiquinone 1 alpha subcomplex subunit 12 [Tieghemostelium lacteum]
MTEIIRYCRGVLQRGIKESIKTLYWTGELKYGRMVGEDKSGNRYYENLEEVHGRHRWVEYFDRKNPEATNVPPEWHSWLHHISDKPGEDMLPFSPFYKREHFKNPTGTDGAYTPPNFLFNIEKAKEEINQEEKK